MVVGGGVRGVGGVLSRGRGAGDGGLGGGGWHESREEER